MSDRCENCDRDGCRATKTSTWAAFIACSCDPDMADPCPHQRAIHAAESDCHTHAVNWRDRALAVEADLAALRESNATLQAQLDVVRVAVAALAAKRVEIPAHPRHDVAIGPGRWQGSPNQIELDPKRTR